MQRIHRRRRADDTIEEMSLPDRLEFGVRMVGNGLPASKVGPALNFTLEDFECLLLLVQRAGGLPPPNAYPTNLDRWALHAFSLPERGRVWEVTDEDTSTDQLKD